ncbi:MAG: class I SAM-dependent methyltransferase [Candidatus Helarchaeota archaeon]
MKDISFRIMAFMFKIRDLFSPPVEKLRKVGIKEGQFILDFGCGPGSYSIAASQLVGENGRVYALDKLPIAIKMVNKKAQKLGLKNIKTIKSNLKTELGDNSIDVVILFDVIHEIDDKQNLFDEMYRILKSNGILSVSDHHFQKEELLSLVLSTNKYELKDRIKNIFNFIKK